MGRETQETRQETTAEPTAEEQELNILELERARAAQPGQIQAQGSGLNLINQLLTGGQLPGGFEGLFGGISEDVTGELVQRSLEDIRPGLQAQGLLDSGTRAELEARTAADVRLGSEQFNLQNLFNLLGLGIGGQAQIQQPILSQSQALGQRLAGLRTGAGTTTFTDNPFSRSFKTSAGQTAGGGLGGIFF